MCGKEEREEKKRRGKGGEAGATKGGGERKGELPERIGSPSYIIIIKLINKGSTM